MTKRPPEIEKVIEYSTAKLTPLKGYDIKTLMHPMPGLLVAQSIDPEIKYFVIESDSFTVGRNGDTAALNDRYISGLHCKIEHLNNHWILKDLGSTNGTYVNGERLFGETDLNDETMIRLGKTIFVFHGNVLELIQSVAADHGYVDKFHMNAVVMDMRRAVSAGEKAILLVGDTGVGKEIAAGVLRKLYGREARPYVTYNVARLNNAEKASALFFGVAGKAFTGVAGRPGLIEECDKGVLLLDEFHGLSEEVQRSLLRVIETGEIQRDGAIHATTSDVCFIFATNNVNEKYFGLAHDILNRLHVIEIPNLKKRLADIPAIFNHWLGRKMDSAGIDKRLVFEKLKTNHYERLMLQDFSRTNIRGIINLAGRIAGAYSNGQNLKEAIEVAFSEIHLLENKLRMEEKSLHIDGAVTTLGIDSTQGVSVEADRYAPKYERLKRQIINLYRFHGNLSKVENALKEMGIPTCYRTLKRYLFEWGVIS